MTTARKALGLLPTCATTGIGSLPHSQGELALQMALQNDVPYLPQLPKQNPWEFMIPSALDGLPGVRTDDDGLCLIDVAEFEKRRATFTQQLETALGGTSFEAFEPSAQACRSWRPFLFELETRKFPFAKVQLAGPLTVRWSTKLTDGTPVADVPAVEQVLTKLSLAKSLALIRGVRRANPNATPILFVDEPGLYALQRGNVRHTVALQELKMMVVALQREGALVGLHCCGNTDWAAVLDLGLDIVSLDARLSLDALLEERDAWLRFIASGATLCLGIVPTDLASTWSLSELCESVEAALRATTPSSTSFEALLSRMLLTPACGLGMRSVIDAENITEQVREAQRRFRALISA